MTLKELKAIALEEAEAAIKNGKSKDCAEEQVIGMFKLYRRIKKNFTDDEYNDMLDTMLDVLAEVKFEN